MSQLIEAVIRGEPKEFSYGISEPGYVVWAAFRTPAGREIAPITEGTGITRVGNDAIISFTGAQTLSLPEGSTLVVQFRKPGQTPLQLSEPLTIQNDYIPSAT